MTAIDSGAFEKCTGLKSIVIPKSVKTIGSNAFSGCKKLDTILIKGTKLKKIEANAFKGTSKKAVAKVPKKKFRKYKKLLKKAKFKGKVKKQK